VSLEKDWSSHKEMQKALTRDPPIRMLPVLHSSLLFVAVSFTIVLLGCARSVPPNDADNERNPYYQKAKRMYELSDYQAAAGLYERALTVDPQSAPAHLELGLLYDEKLGDPIAAIYHYRQYLALRPDSDKRQLVQDFIDRARLSLAGKLPQAPTVDPNQVARLKSENAGLMQENIALKARVAELERGVAARPSEAQDSAVDIASSATATQVAIAASSAVVDTPKPNKHIVQKGDTLQSLALKYYGTRSAWDKIYQANRNVLPSKDQLKIGQQLILP
jgi:tetratricopeptide (TPR) repeat protein